MTGSIMFSIVERKPDIAFATSLISHFVKNPGHQHTKAVKIILQYLKGFRKRGILYGDQEKLLVEGYLDSDQAGDKKSQKSTFDFIFMLNGGSVSWYSKKQVIMALLSIKAKYIALILVAKGVTQLQLLFTKLSFLQLHQQHALIKISKHNTSIYAF